MKYLGVDSHTYANWYDAPGYRIAGVISIFKSAIKDSPFQVHEARVHAISLNDMPASKATDQSACPSHNT